MNHKEHVLGELELHQHHAREALQCLLHSIIFLRAPNLVRPREVHCRRLRLSFAKVDRPTAGAGISTSAGGGSGDAMGGGGGGAKASASASAAGGYDSVDGAIDACLRSLSPAGPNLYKGRVTLTFFEQRTKTSMFGLIQTDEKVIFEEWVIPFLVDSALLGSGTNANTSGGSGGGDSFEEVDVGDVDPFGRESDEQHQQQEREGSTDAHAVERRRVQERTEALVRQRLEEVFHSVNSSIDHIPPSTYHFELSYGSASRRDRGQDLATKIRNSPALIHTMGP